MTQSGHTGNLDQKCGPFARLVVCLQENFSLWQMPQRDLGEAADSRLAQDSLEPNPLKEIYYVPAHRRPRPPSYSRILAGTTFSGGLDPGGLIDRMKAMIFQRSSEVLTAKPIFGIPACIVPYWMR